MKTLIERYEEKLATFDQPSRPGAAIVVQVDDLRALIAEHKALHEAAGAVLRIAEDSCIDCSFCSKAAMRVDERRAFCDEHIGRHRPDDGHVRELSHAAPLRALRAALKEGP